MKKIVLLIVFFPCFLFSQNEEKKVLDLLLQNKRTEARKSFDKGVRTKSDLSIENLILDAMIEIESGNIDFDETFVTKFARFPESKYYVNALLKKAMLLSEVSETGFNESIERKIDYMMTQPNLKGHPAIVYYKGTSDRNQRKFDDFNKWMAEINAIHEWQRCGVFENLNDSGLDIEYEPETYPQNDKLFNANSNGMVGWYNPAVKSDEMYEIFLSEAEYGAGIMYCQTFMDNPVGREVYLNFGSSSSIKIFLNDTEIYANNLAEKSDIDAYRVKFFLPKGMNRLLVKLALNGDNYFTAGLTDTSGSRLQDVVCHNSYKPYAKTDLAVLNPSELPNESELFFIEKIKSNPQNTFYKLLLYDTYMHNKKLEKALSVIEDIEKTYPNSSLIKIRLIDYYTAKDELNKIEEIFKNLEFQDPDYFFSKAAKMRDSEWLKTASIAEIEELRTKICAFPSKLLCEMMDFITIGRSGKLNDFEVKINEILANYIDNEFIITTLAPFYDHLNNDKARSIETLEALFKKRNNYKAFAMLAAYYNDAGKKDLVKKMYFDKHNEFPYYADITKDYIDLLIENKDYKEAIAEIDKSLTLFPYSFQMMEKKGKVLQYQNENKNAEVYYRKSLVHNSGNTQLRRTLYDMLKIPNEIDQVKTADAYKYIKEKRNTKLKGDYGVSLLLDQYIINVLPEGGRDYKVIIIYEITDENGIEIMKEYDLNTNSITLQKSEIVKPDGSLVPAEDGGDKLVFTNLKVNDVIYIEYEYHNSGYGRFYKDFNDSYELNGIYPCLKSIFNVIHPENVTVNEAYVNSKASPVIQKKDGKVFKTWTLQNTPALPLLQDYAPTYEDIKDEVLIGTIKSWKDIANWYADLVKKTLKTDKITTDTFNTIFPQGTAGLSQSDKAKKIYTYITDNISYSSLDFRQSGYVPQKPSKTIQTKLGDCKDVSTLFVALATMADIKSNLVLVSTNDNGINAIKLPTLGFNHCIARAALDGKEHFIELTDKYLPFNTLPTSLYNANALVVSFDKKENENAGLQHLLFENTQESQLYSKLTVDVDDKSRHFSLKAIRKGYLNAYCKEIFSNSLTEDVRKKALEDDYNEKLSVNISGLSAKPIYNESQEVIGIESQFDVSAKLQSLGNLKVVEIPFIERAYTPDLVKDETRDYDIRYVKYENARVYDYEIIMNIAEGKKFMEVPENKSFQYKGHNFSLTFELTKPNSLKIHRKVSLSWEDITKEEYPEFRKYVEEVIEAEKQIIGFK